MIASASSLVNRAQGSAFAISIPVGEASPSVAAGVVEVLAPVVGVASAALPDAPVVAVACALLLPGGGVGPVG
jgi:hypothetical protein